MARREHQPLARFAHRLPTVVLALATLAFDAGAQTPTDGNTVRLNTMTYRLWAIDAPDALQTCGADWPAGRKAAETLGYLMHGRTVVCEAKTRDRAANTVALCRADGVDLGAAMVRIGMAWARREISRDYVEAEDQARVARLGVHGHGCKTAWEWRKNVAKSRRDESQ
jgi:endonuclease YncB( thermonuclease family)